MAERLGKGLQNPVQRFNSASDLILTIYPHVFHKNAAVVELVDTGDLKSPDRKVMRVRFSPAAQTKNAPTDAGAFFIVRLSPR